MFLREGEFLSEFKKGSLADPTIKGKVETVSKITSHL